MDPIISTMQMQIASIQANVEWLTRLVWAMIALNGATFLLNGYLGALMVRNNNKRSEDK